MSKTIAINSGSSSLKFALYEMPEEVLLASGLIERIGDEKATFKIETPTIKLNDIRKVEDHKVAVDIILEALLEHNVINSADDIEYIGHRVVHGGEKFKTSVVITDKVIEGIDELSDLAPLHNPMNLMGIKVINEKCHNAKSVAVFDTAFHQTMPKEAFVYPTPYEWYEKYSVRKYGFHGTSHRFIAHRTQEILAQNDRYLKIISAHIGNGASICAIKNGESINTTMGLTPLAGITMGTRSGSIDPAIIEFISEKEERSISYVIKKLNKGSGLLGISGISNDGRDIREGIKNGIERCKLAFDIQVNSIVKAISYYYVLLEGADVIVFTAGAGENDKYLRKAVCDKLKIVGVNLSEERNNNVSGETLISMDDSPVKVMVIPTQEELMVARDAYYVSNMENNIKD
ncbi:MAG: acetate/propionate family kinase [Clostridiaceae bacterium]